MTETVFLSQEWVLPTFCFVTNYTLSHLTRKTLDVLTTYLVFPEHCLDEFGSFIEFSLLMIRQS